MRRSTHWMFALALLPVAACSSNKPVQTPVAAATAPAAPALSPADESFIKQAAASDAFEIQSSQLAASKAHRATIKSFASQMVEAHTQTTQQLMQIVQGTGMTPPATQMSDEQQQMLAKLGNESGARFEHDYVHDQVAGHGMAVNVFQQEISNGQNADIKAFAEKTLPIIQQHLSLAQNLPGAMPHKKAGRHHHRMKQGTSSNTGADMNSDTNGSAD